MADNIQVRDATGAVNTFRTNDIGTNLHVPVHRLDGEAAALELGEHHPVGGCREAVGVGEDDQAQGRTCVAAGGAGPLRSAFPRAA